MSQTLPADYMITGKFSDHADFQTKLEQALAAGPKVVQLRCKGMADTEYLEIARQAEPICRRHGATLLLATTVEVFGQTAADGLHLSSDRLTGLSQRPIPAAKLLSVSCHTRADLALADSLGADILLLSPVKPTSAHPDLPGLGWERFREMTAGLKQPVYGLGGMSSEDVDDAWEAGAQGIAATKGFWG